jgi:hypothetical protein
VSLSQSPSALNPSGGVLMQPQPFLSQVTIRFEQTGATFVAVDAASTQLYGSFISLVWRGGTPVQAALT